MTQEQEAGLIDALLTAEEALQLVHVKAMEECTAALVKLNRVLAALDVCEPDAAEGKGRH